MKPFLDVAEDDPHKLLTEVVHKIKNSLGGMGGFAALLERDLGPDDPRTPLARRIQDGVIRTNDFVVNLMTYLQKPEGVLKSADPIPMIRQAWFEFWRESEPPECDFRVPDPESLPSLKCDLHPETFRKLVLSVFNLAVSSGGRIDGVRFAAAEGRTCVFEVAFPESSNLRMESRRDGAQRILSCEPIEAKLSLYLVVKMSKFNKARVFLAARNPGQITLTVQLDKATA
jgi:hypothetical protein